MTGLKISYYELFINIIVYKITNFQNPYYVLICVHL